MLLRRTFLVGLLGLLPTLSAGCPCCPATARAEEPPKAAVLGAESRAPTAEEAKTYGLAGLHGRPAGLYITGVEKGRPADKAGLAEGDVLLSLEANKFFSRDDLDDFLRTARPGSKVKALVKRADTFSEETVTVTLGSGPAANGGHFSWQFAGTAQLDRALAAAKKENKLVLIGLSGAET